MKKIIFLWLCLFYLSPALAQEITIVYTADTRSALYPCHCPAEPDGGIARRATKIKELRKQNPNLLVLDAGNIFAGSPLDFSRQNPELDKKRTLINLEAIKLMQYDAVALGMDEFNFGKDFLKEQIENINLPFLSSNLKIEKVAPYLIKKIGGLKIALLALTAPQVKDRVPDLEVSEPRTALKSVLSQIEKENVDLVILLTNFLLGEERDLIKEFPQINILITPPTHQEQIIDKIGATIVLQAVREGRRLGLVRLNLKEKKITDYKTEEIRLSSEIKDDPKILAILPKCFSNRDCLGKAGTIGQCKNAAELNAECVFVEIPKVSLMVIKPKVCLTCNIEGQLNLLKTYLGNVDVEVKYLDYESSPARQLIKDLGISFLPAFILSKDIEKEESFEVIKEKVVQKGNYYLVKPEIIGISYLADRKRTPATFDLFISLFDKNTAELLERAKPYKPKIHFLVVEDVENKTFSCPHETKELEEDLRAVCIMKDYPDKALDYLICRAKNIESSWWDDCAREMDINKIKNCAKSQQAKELLKENINLNEELLITTGPTYLLSNQEIFSSRLNPSAEELKRIMEANK
ncbi:MAG: hypothetical protein NC936_02340 [Candidatus Omnitrophica bacterium]|nr:hypothetical protein [Candidatus Omnitrophota bacterium]